MKMLGYLFAIAVITACQKGGSSVSPLPPASNSPKTWLALGDSYTIGQGVTEENRFPYQTALWLKQNGLETGTPNYIARTGWTSSMLINNLEAQHPPVYDIVSLLIGVNDQYQKHDTTGYRDQFTYLLEKAIQLAKGNKDHVYVLSIPDYSVTPFAQYNDTATIRKELDLFNSINKEVTEKYRCAYINITPSTREARTNRGLLADDGLHPSGIEYKKWAQLLGPVILGSFK